MAPRRDESPFDTYLREIREHRVLTAPEERALGHAIQAAAPRGGQWLARGAAADDSPLAAIEQMRAESAAHEARLRLTLHNLRLVVAVAKRWANRGLALPDLVAEGNLGLQHAVDLFDPGRSVRFSTYATWWIQQAIRRALTNTVRTVRIPRHMAQELARWRTWARRFEQREGRAPLPEEVARAMPGTPAKRRILARVYGDAGLSGGTVSLDALFEDDGQRVPDARADVPGESGALEPGELDALRGALEGLEPREARILRVRFGLDGGAGPTTLRDAGKDLGLSRERVRQLEKSALAKLRAALDRPRPARRGR